MIMAYLTFKQPLPPDQISPSLNELMLPSQEQLAEEAKIDDIFKLYIDEYDADKKRCDDEDCDYDDEVVVSGEMKGAFVEGEVGYDIVEKASRAMIKSLTPSSD